jgi:hypothetical protein
MKENKLEILKDLFVDESHTLEDLKKLREKTKDFFKIEQKTGNVLISHEYNFTVKEKIILFMIGKYFCEEVGFEKENITSRLLSEVLHIQQTSLTAPLGELVSQHILSKEDTTYAIKYYQIEKQLDLLNEKHILKAKLPHTKVRAIVKNKKSKPNKSKVISRKQSFNETQTQLLSEEEILEIIKNENIELNDLYSIFNIRNNKLILLKGFKSQNNRESHIKSSLLTLVAHKIFYGSERISSANLRTILQDSGVRGLINLSTTLKEYSYWIVHERGQIGSINTSYRITHEGYRKGLDLLRDIINNTSTFQLKLSNSRITSREVAPPFKISQDNLNKKISEFSRIEKIDENELKMKFDFQEDHIRIIEPLIENTRKIMQIKNLLLLGYLIRKIYEQDKFNCIDLLKNSGVNSDRLDLLDSNKFYKKYFSVKKSKTAMSLIHPGEVKAKEYLTKYLTEGTFEL